MKNKELLKIIHHYISINNEHFENFIKTEYINKMVRNIDENLYNKMGKEISYKCVVGLEETIEQED